MTDEIRKGQGSSGSGKSPTKFMERPGSKKPEEKKREPEQSHPEFINDDLDALENQEKDEEQSWQSQDFDKAKPKGDQKPDQRKFPEPDKRDSRSDDTGDCACP